MNTVLHYIITATLHNNRSFIAILIHKNTEIGTDVKIIINKISSNGSLECTAHASSMSRNKKQVYFLTLLPFETTAEADPSALCCPRPWNVDLATFFDFSVSEFSIRSSEAFSKSSQSS